MSERIEIGGVKLGLIVETKAHKDGRGQVEETYRASWFPELPPVQQLVQSTSLPNTLRGMHFHKRQWDIWRFTAGSAIVRLYDTKTDTNTNLFGDQDVVLAIPPGISHGFYTEKGCTLLYALTEEYDGTDEFGWYPFDGKGLFPWPRDPYGVLVSPRDLRAPGLIDFE